MRQLLDTGDVETRGMSTTYRIASTAFLRGKVGGLESWHSALQV
jgi:hypothetical protein